MRPILKIALTAVTIITTSCTENIEFDGSSDEAFAESLAKARETMTQEELQAFDEAIEIVYTNQIGNQLTEANWLITLSNPSVIQGAIMTALDGKTPAQVISQAEELLLEEMRELQAEETIAASAQESLSDFQIVSSDYRLEEAFASTNPIIELTVLNNTEHSISRAHFEGTLSSPGRAVPWIQEEFNYRIQGGLEPGEEAHWVLSPNRFMGWGDSGAPDDAEFTVIPIELDGPDGEPIFSTQNFTSDDKARLLELQARFSTNTP